MVPGTDGEGDGLGDACDPNLCDAQEGRDTFLGFVVDPTWQSDTAAWTHDGQRVAVATTGPSRYVAPYLSGHASVMTSIQVASTPPFRVGVQMGALGGARGTRCAASSSTTAAGRGRS